MLKNNINIYRATKKDIPFLVKSDQEILDYHRNFDNRYKKGVAVESVYKKFISRDIKKPNTYYYIVEKNEKPIGYFSFNIRKLTPIFILDKIAYLETMYIQKKYRGLGLGKMIFNYMAGILKKKKIKKIELSVNTKNKLGVAVWTSMGFKEVSKKMERNIL